MALITKRVILHRDGKKTVIATDDPKLLAFALQPFPMLALKGPNGSVRRYVNFPMEIEDEEQLVVATAGGSLAG